MAESSELREKSGILARRTHALTAELRRWKVEKLDWPARSADLNPVEHVRGFVTVFFLSATVPLAQSKTAREFAFLHIVFFKSKIMKK